jgi:Ca2+-binding EF-hand superfamily protein
MSTLLQKLRAAMIEKGLKTLPMSFKLFDPENLGLVSFQAFSLGLDQILKISDKSKENLFMKLDKSAIGLFSYEQYKKLMNTTDGVGLRLYDKDVPVEDSFDWEQSLVRDILDWILDKRLSLAEAFKLMDIDFDGVLSPADLNTFLQNTFKIDIHRYRLKLDCLFKILDRSKSGRIYLVDFENTFKSVYKQEHATTGIKRAKSAL